MKTRNLILLMLCFILFLGEIALSGTTGKIAGRVTDAETGEPLPGANVTIQNTSMGAATDLDGRFVMINIPPGVYTLRFSMMGYETRIVQNIRVSIDLTTTMNAKLNPSVIAGEEVTVVAERPMVQMDMTSSISSVAADQIKDLPVQSVDQVLELQAGIVKQGGDFHIRGGRGGEVAFWVDGVPVTNVMNYSQGITVENTAIEELQVISGTFNAEYGQAMSGIVNIITKEGKSEYDGQIRGWVGDYVSGRNEYAVLDRVETVYDSAGQPVAGNGVYNYPLEGWNPDYNLDFSLSGPVPGFGDKLTFFTNARFYDYTGHLYGANWHLPTGVPGDSSLVPMSQGTNYSGQGKLTWRPSGNFKASYNFIYNQSDRPYGYSQEFKYVPYGTQEGHNKSQSHILSLNHVLSSKTFYEVRLNYFKTEWEGYTYENPTQMPDYLVYVYPDSGDTGVLPEEWLDPFDNAADSARFETLKQARRDFEYYIDPNGPEGYISPDSASTPVSYSFRNDGMSMNHSSNSTQTFIGKFDLSSQINNNHLIKTGIEVRMHELQNHYFNVIAGVDPNSNEQIVPFTPSVPELSSPQRGDYVRNPREVSAYIQDKVELREIIFNIGLRFDWFDPNYVVPTDPHDPDIYHPLRPETTYRDWVDPPEGLSQAEYTEYVAGFEEMTPEERKSIMHTDVDPKMQVSPRLGIAYPISDAGVIHFSYGHFFQIPEFSHLYDNPDFKISPQGGYRVFGNADLGPQKTVMYEIGLQQQLTKDIGIDVTLFYRDVRDWVGTSPLVETLIPSMQYSQYENKDYSNVRGITLKLEKRYSNNFSANVDYTFQFAEGTYSNPTDAFNAFQANEQPRLNLIPMGWDRRHSLNGSIIYSLKGYTASLIGRFYTGFPYTPSFPRAEIVGGAALSGLRENSERLPTRSTVDLRLNRRFQLGSTDLNVFCYIRNLFDSNDATSVYSDTGDPAYTTEYSPDRVSYSEKRIGTVEDYILQPAWYTAPRQIQIGVSLGF